MSETLHQLEQLAATGTWDGPSYRYRGAEIHCLPGGQVCGLAMTGRSLNGVTFGVAGAITPLIDAWLDEGQLPRRLRSADQSAART